MLETLLDILLERTQLILQKECIPEQNKFNSSSMGRWKIPKGWKGGEKKEDDTEKLCPNFHLHLINHE